MATKMETLRIIDADTHVDETDATWEYMTPEEQGFKPTKGSAPDPDPARPPFPYWLIDGHKERRSARSDAKSKTTVETRELLDVEARLRHMDELGTEIQVIYPTLFISDPAVRPEVELALTRSYNRWLADRCGLSKGRLRWICIPPLKTMDKAVEELRWAKDHGACGVSKKGDQEAGHYAAEDYFFPLYEEAERLDLPICFHTGTGTALERRWLRAAAPTFLRSKATAITGIHSFLERGIPAMFPKLRTGCIEASASWLPFVEHTIRRAEKKHTSRQLPPKDIFTTNRIYVACQMDENLPLVFQYISEDNLLVGSDYTHEDPSQDHGFIVPLQQAADRGEIPDSAVRKIVYDNPKTFYAL